MAKNYHFRFSRSILGLVLLFYMCACPDHLWAGGLTKLSKPLFQSPVTGTVVSKADGLPLPGVSVAVKGSSNIVVTDLDGKYTIAAPANAVLVFSFTSFKTQEIPVKGQLSIDIKLEESTTQLEEVVVVGYGKMKKKDLTGSVVQVKADNLADQNPQTVQDVLRGVPGLKVGYSSDAKGGGSLQIRGQTSVYTGGSHNSPLIIFDGMQFYGELSEINPDDIDQIDILKDASATAVYGSRAAAGVIIITTKKGKTGKPVITISSNMTVNSLSAYPDVYDANGYAKYREDWETAKTYGFNTTTGQYEAYVAARTGQVGYFSNPDNLSQYGITLDQWLAYQPANETVNRTPREIWGRRLGIVETSLINNFTNGKTQDWYKSTFRTGFNKDYNMSISGASDRSNYYMSVGYLDAEGAIVGDEYRAIRSNFKVSSKVTDWLEVGANVNFQDRTDGNISVGTGTNYWDANMMRNSPYADFTDANGAYVRQPMGPTIGGYNYYYDRQFMDLEKGYTVLNTVFNTKVTLPYGITYSFNIAPRYQFFYDRYFQSSGHEGWNPVNIGANRGHAKNFDYNLNNNITWDHTFGDKHHIIATFVQEAEDRKYWSDNITARNILPTDILGFHNTSNATLLNSGFSTSDSHQSADALMGRLFYSYDERYMITGTIRRDGYSAFGNNNPYATFPSVAVGWNFANEKWFKWEPMNMGKLRLSYGKNGNRALADPYVWLANLSSGTGATMGYINPTTGAVVDMKYLTLDRMANPNLQWEKTTAFNAGLDFGFLNDRITGTIEVYKSKTHDMIMTERLTGFTGFPSIVTNLGEVQNSGYEISLTTVNMKTPNFEWRTLAAFSYNKNRINKLYGNMIYEFDENGNITSQREGDDIANGWFIGKPISAIWSHKVIGIWQKDEYEEARRYGQRPGDPKIANIYTADDGANGTPVYNNNDRVFMGQTDPPINWSLRNEFTLYKNWNIAVNMYSYMGHKSLDTRYMNNFNAGSMYTNNYNAFVNPYWTVDNPTQDWARLDAVAPAGASAGKLYNRNFIRLDHISIGYTIPRAFTEKWNIKTFRLTASVRNVATWAADWKYFGDPETGGLATRMFNFGLNLTL
ncbi:SusC/RagA family TonB-linked outer membrane protein [Flavobacterium sp. Sd200]|uniref:SusC/RagA family TonB-linked outer membrane protein n=1 Tax=Flavobacterium sp. Sd200 TaxID=2692211 RepID=UPI0013715EB0|nr:SusC/RagA family TonB-linked outer membrane protein [Flavobacterium sp. Sd200]MXN90910.1 SusC/RagA family TonB-linked outer membrane protein [Flavobacterium sp. Sd200]